MKKKSGNKDLDNELDFDDLEGLDGEMDFGDLENIDDSRSTGGSKPGAIAKELAEEAGKGFLDSVAKKTASKALPESYSNNYYAAMEYGDFAKETFGANKSKINKSLYNLGKEVKKILPFQSKMLDGFLSKYETDFEQFKSQTEEQIREGSIQSDLASIFDKQLDIQKAFEAKRSSEAQVDKKQKLAIDKVNIDVLTSIDGNISNQTAFTLQISKEYYRKSLELQYKSYFIQSDMLKTMRDYYKGFSLQLENIAKYTSLPDFVKLNTSERVSEVLRTQFIQNTYKQLFSSSDYVKNVKNKVSNLISEKISGITDGLDQATEALGGLNAAGEYGGGGARVLGGVMSGMGGGILGEKAGNWLGPKLQEKIKDNKTINTGGNLLQMLANSPRTLFASLKGKAEKGAEEYQDESSPLRFLASKLFGGANELLGVTDPGIKNFGVKKSSILEHNKPAIFDNKVHRSITEVIPLYLSKILATNTNLNSMYKSVNWQNLYDHQDDEEQVYDYENRKLSTKAEFKLAMEKSVFKDNSKESKKVEGVASNINSLALSSAEKSGNKDDVKLLKNKKAQKSFSDFMSLAGEKLSAEDFNYDNLVTNIEQNADLALLVKKNPTLAKYIEVLKKNDLSMKHVNLNEKVLDTKRVYPTLAVIELFKSTSTIAESKELNKINGDVANKLAEGFTRYITSSNSVITLDTIISGQCFKLMKDKDIDVCMPYIQIFVGQCKIIKYLDDYLKETQFEALLGVMNESLLNNFEIDPEVFQKLYDYSPDLQEDGKLSIRNLVEGKLGKEKDDIEFADISKIKSIAGVKTKDVKSLAREKTKTNVFAQIESSGFYQELTKFTDIASTFKKDIAEAGSAKEIGASVKTMFGAVVKQSQESSKKFYASAEKEFTEGLNKINKAIENVTEKNAPIVKESMISTVKQMQNKVEVLIKAEEESLKVMEAQLEEIKKTLQENIDDPKTFSTSKHSLSLTLTGKKVEIKALKKFKGNLQATLNRINNIDTNGINISDLLGSAFSALMALKTEAEDTLALFEAESKAQAEAVAQ